MSGRTIPPCACGRPGWHKVGAEWECERCHAIWVNIVHPGHLLAQQLQRDPGLDTTVLERQWRHRRKIAAEKGI